MDINKIKVGSTYDYRSKAHAGKGKVESKIETHSDGTPLKTGPYVRLFDKVRNKFVCVRPSQVGKQ